MMDSLVPSIALEVSLPNGDGRRRLVGHQPYIPGKLTYSWRYPPVEIVVWRVVGTWLSRVISMDFDDGDPVWLGVEDGLNFIIRLR